MAQPADFDIEALYEALDAQRVARGMSWQEVAGAISDPFRDGPARPISASTLTGMRGRSVVEGDGVLQMLRWLRRTPESFIPGHEATAPLPEVRPGQILRFDTRRLYEAVDARRIERGMTWRAVAGEIPGVGVASLSRLSKGGRTGFPQVSRLARWLGLPLASFTRAADR
jgi:hypothetical protein